MSVPRLDSRRWMQLVAASSDLGWDCSGVSDDRDAGTKTYTYRPRQAFGNDAYIKITITVRDEITGEYHSNDELLKLDTRYMIRTAFLHGRTAVGYEMLAWLLVDTGFEEDWPLFERAQARDNGVLAMLNGRLAEIRNVLRRLS